MLTHWSLDYAEVRREGGVQVKNKGVQDVRKNIEGTWDRDFLPSSIVAFQ